MVRYALGNNVAQNDPILDLPTIEAFNGYPPRLEALLHRRQFLTERLKEHGKCYPPLLLERAITYEALEYDDLAVFDAYAVYLLCLKHLSDEFVTDLEAHDLNGEVWNPSKSGAQELLVDVLALLVRSLHALGATKDAREKLSELAEQLQLVQVDEDADHNQSIAVRLRKPNILRPSDDPISSHELLTATTPTSRFGHSRREIYPWSTYEPDRNSPESLTEINAYLADIAPNLEAKVTELPALDNTGQATDEKWLQLGLFAKHDLKPGQEILREKSILTAIRPLDAAICDACGQDLDKLPFEEIQQCDGEDCDITFCSEECKERAIREYHRPYIEEPDAEDQDNSEVSQATDSSSNTYNENDDTQPSQTSSFAPFCGNTDLHTIGRPTLTSTAEWDLYFLLLTRTISMSLTQNTHPLKLKEIKYLWGDFSSSTTSTSLPLSLSHNVIQPLDFFTTLSLSSIMPYTPVWLEMFDPWILQTLYAKFRGVANAQQSTFDGEPEIAAVHPGWCLANHSCGPNVNWTPTGVRKFIVSPETGIEAGQEILSHYTDVRLPLAERRERLLEVLGGLCRCQRCLRESAENI